MIIRKIIIIFTVLLLPLLSVTPYISAATYTYDDNGNLKSDTVNCYEYNDANRLFQVKLCSNGQLIEKYFYDHEGERVKKQIFENGTLIKTVYNPDKEYETVKLASNSATLNTRYYYVGGEIVARKNPDNSKFFYLTDHLGSNTVLTDESGNQVESTSYYPFGKVESGGKQSKHLYTGQENDSNTGLYFYNARYYSAGINRFIQPDSIIQNPYDPQMLNRYAYVRNNPIRYTDSSGHFIDTFVDAAFIGYDIGRIISEPKNSWNYAALAMDVGFALVPGITGGGVGVRALEHSVGYFSKAIDATILGSKVTRESEVAAYSARYLTEHPGIGWKVGEPINNLTKLGVDPVWSTVRQRFWKNESFLNSSIYSSENLFRMETGLAPQIRNQYGILESLELHHTPPQRFGGLYNFDIVTHAEHAAIDKYVFPR